MRFSIKLIEFDMPKFLVKTFFLCGLLLSLFFSSFSDYSISFAFLIEFLIQVIIFGLISTLIFYYLKKKEIKKIGQSKFTDDFLNNIYTSEFSVKLSFDELVEIIRSDAFVKKIINENNVITLKNYSTSFSPLLQSQKITIIAKPNENSMMDISVKSQPSCFLFIYDFGRNFQNVKNFKYLIQSRALDK